MSLKVKCKKCNLNLDFDIRSPGLIVVGPCESCMQQMEIMDGNRTTGEYFATADAVAIASPGGKPEFEALQERIFDSRKQETDVDDGNDWRPVKER